MISMLLIFTLWDRTEPLRGRRRIKQSFKLPMSMISGPNCPRYTPYTEGFTTFRNVLGGKVRLMDR